MATSTALSAKAAGILASEPEILTANCFHWRSFGVASSRRSAENRRQTQAGEWLEKAGLKVSYSGNSVSAVGEGIEVEFSYSESCNNVYKSFSVYRHGKKSNIKGLRGWIAAQNK